MLRKLFERSKQLPLLVIAAFALTACGQGSSNSGNVAVDGVTGPTVSIVNNTFIMSMTLNDVSFSGGGQVPIPNMPNSYIEVGPDLQSNGLLISVGISVTDLANLLKGDIDLLSPQTLPGGRPLPGLADGYLPAIAIQVPKWDNIVFYVGSNVFGVFVPVTIPLENYIATFRFYDSSGDAIGNLSVVGEDTNKANSGVLLLINIAGKIATLLNSAP